MTKSKQMCVGCHDDFYNHNRPEGCWRFASAQVVKRVKVGIWEPPPYAQDRAEKCLWCFHPQGYAMLELTDCRVVSDVKETRERWEKEARERMAARTSVDTGGDEGE